MIKDSGSDYFGMDGRLLTSFNDADLGWNPIGPLPCYATNHGHAPGHNFYHDYKNGQFILSELRRRNPGIFLEIYWGIKRAYPWGLAALNGCENYYESNGHQDDRMQSWYNQNYRFLPNYVNFAQVRGYTDQEIRKEILSAISLTSHLQIGVGVKLLDRAENQDFFRRWTQWAAENHQFLRVKRDLFGQPWSIPLDGSAHMLEDRGYLFLFNESAADQVGSIPLNSWIGLTKGSEFDIKQIYPVEKLLAQGIRWDEKALVPVAASGASVIAVERANSRSLVSPEITWHNLAGAEVTIARAELCVSGLVGYQGQRCEVVILTNGVSPKRLTVNGIDIPFLAMHNLILAELDFGSVPVSPPSALGEWWVGARLSSSGDLLADDSGPLSSPRMAGSGVYEVDMVSDFTRGGFFFRADAEKRNGLVAAAMLSGFPPTDGNIGLWNATFPQFPITWTLGKKLKKGQHYRFRIESYGDRHSFSIADPKEEQTLAGPLAYRVATIEPEGAFGVLVEKGPARVTGFKFTPASQTLDVRPRQVRAETLVHDAFTSRELTRRMGQLSPKGVKTVIGGDTAIEFNYAQEEKNLWGNDKK